MQASRASRGITEGDTNAAQTAVTEAYTMSRDLQDEQLQARSWFWIGVVEFYGGNLAAARAALREAESCSQWELPQDEVFWLGKWVHFTEKGCKPSENRLDYQRVAEATTTPHSAFPDWSDEEDWDEDEEPAQFNQTPRLRTKAGTGVGGLPVKSAEKKRSMWDPLRYYI